MGSEMCIRDSSVTTGIEVSMKLATLIAGDQNRPRTNLAHEHPTRPRVASEANANPRTFKHQRLFVGEERWVGVCDRRKPGGAGERHLGSSPERRLAPRIVAHRFRLP